jgi:OmpA-OmpF porin, OOP family
MAVATIGRGRYEVSTHSPFIIQKENIMLRKIAAGAALVLVTSMAMADDAPHFYGGADLLTSRLRYETSRESGYGLFAGYQFNPTFGLEVGSRSLVDIRRRFSEPVPGWYRIEMRQVAISGTAAIPLTEKLKLFSRLGYNRVTFRNSHSFGMRHRDHYETVLYGVGLKYDFTPAIAGRIELQKPAGYMSTLSAGVSFSF